MPIWVKEGFFGKFHLSDFYLLVVSYHAAKFEKNPFRKSGDISLHNFGPQLGPKWPFSSKEDFFWKLSYFSLLIVPYYAANFEKNP